MLQLTLMYIAVCLLTANLIAIYTQSTLFLEMLNRLLALRDDTFEDFASFEDYEDWLLENVPPFWYDLLSCSFCLSHWIALFLGWTFGIVFLSLGWGVLFGLFCMLSVPILVKRIFNET